MNELPQGNMYRAPVQFSHIFRSNYILCDSQAQAHIAASFQHMTKLPNLCRKLLWGVAGGSRVSEVFSATN